jgi:hypothetical protein
MIGKADAVNRPFYAFVFSPNGRDLDDFIEKLKRHFPDIRAMIFSDDAISSSVELPSALDANYASEEPPDKPYYWQMITTKNLRSDMEDFFVYKFTHKIKPTYPVKTLGSHLSFKVYRYNLSNNEFDSAGLPLTSDIKLEPANEGEAQPANSGRTQTFLLKPRRFFEEDKKDGYSFYAVEQTSYVKDIEDEVAEWSTRDDSTPDTANKTYRFKELVLTLLDVHLKDRLLPRISPRIFLTIANQ